MVDLSHVSGWADVRDWEIRRLFNTLKGDYRQDCWELDLVTGGTWLLHCGLGRMSVASGVCFWVRSHPSVYFEPVNRGSGASILQLRFRMDFFPEALLKMQLFQQLSPFFAQAEEGIFLTDESIYSTLMGMLERLSYREGFAFYEALYVLAVRCAQIKGWQKFPVRHWHGEQSDGWLLGRINKYMLGHLSVPFSLSALASVAGMSRASVCRFYKKHTGDTLNEAFNRMRMEKACQLLSSTDMTVKEIAYACGYESPSFFSHIFHRLMGMTPLSYRRRHV